MGSLKDKLARFMYGRYGADQLYYALIVICIIMLVVNSFLRSPVISILLWALLLYALFRVLSRNIYKRRMENEKFIKFLTLLKGKGALALRRIKEIKTHRFRRCPHCSTVLRLPRKRGTHTVTCPRCHNKFKVRILW